MAVAMSGLRTIEIALLCEVLALSFAVLMLRRRAAQRKLRFTRNEMEYNPMSKKMLCGAGNISRTRQSYFWKVVVI